GGAGRLDRGAKASDDALGDRQRDPRARVAVPFSPHDLSLRRHTSEVLASAATTWNLEPLQIVPTLVVSVLYLRRTRTLARRGLPVPKSRQFFFWLGIFLVVMALNSPIDELGERD